MRGIGQGFTLCSAIVYAAMLSGCDYFNTRPGHPESYDTSYFQCSRLWGSSTSKSIPRCADVASAGKSSAEASMGTTNTGVDYANSKQAVNSSQTPVFAIASTPWEIARARGYAFNLYLRYEAAAYKAEDVEDKLAIPIFGLAIGIAASAIAHASTEAIAATGIAGGAASAGFSYLHPDKDAATDQTAEAALLCVVNESKVLNDISAVPLALDKAALQDALTNLELHYGNATDQPTKDAVDEVKAAADAAMQSLNAAISQYVLLPSEIYQAGDTINVTAKKTGARTLDYSSLLSSLKTSATNQSATDDAKKAVQDATETTAKVNPKKKSDTGTADDSTNIKSASSDVKSAADKAPTSAAISSDPSTDQAVGKPSVGDNATKSTTLQELVESSAMNDLVKVTLLSKIALNDIPSPNFSAIAASIKNCSLLN